MNEHTDNAAVTWIAAALVDAVDTGTLDLRGRPWRTEHLVHAALTLTATTAAMASETFGADRAAVLDNLRTRLLGTVRDRPDAVGPTGSTRRAGLAASSVLDVVAAAVTGATPEEKTLLLSALTPPTLAPEEVMDGAGTLVVALIERIAELEGSTQLEVLSWARRTLADDLADLADPPHPLT